MKTFVELSLLRLRRKVRCGALQQMALQKQDFRFSPKDGDGNAPHVFCRRIFTRYFRFSPKIGDSSKQCKIKTACKCRQRGGAR